VADPELTPIPGGELRHDDDGRPIVDVATCGHCGRSWNDALSSGITPTPSGRCPFEYEHESESGFPTVDYRAKLIELDAMLHPENYPRDMQPDHLYWDGREDDESGPGFPFEWSADTIEWVDVFLARTLAGESEFRPITDQE
jgi:hypothetical protein